MPDDFTKRTDLSTGQSLVTLPLSSLKSGRISKKKFNPQRTWAWHSNGQLPYLWPSRGDVPRHYSHHNDQPLGHWAHINSTLALRPQRVSDPQHATAATKILHISKHILASRTFHPSAWPSLQRGAAESRWSTFWHLRVWDRWMTWTPWGPCPDLSSFTMMWRSMYDDVQCSARVTAVLDV